MISDPWIDRSARTAPKPTRKVKPTRVLKTDDERRAEVATKRDQLREAGKCINGPLVGSVGKKGAVHGDLYRAGRCRRCWLAKVESESRRVS